MPTVDRVDGFRIFFFSNEHAPAHVHVERGDELAKIELSPVRVVESHMSGPNLRRAVQIVTERAATYLERWHEHFG